MENFFATQAGLSSNVSFLLLWQAFFSSWNNSVALFLIPSSNAKLSLCVCVCGLVFVVPCRQKGKPFRSFTHLAKAGKRCDQKATKKNGRKKISCFGISRHRTVGSPRPPGPGWSEREREKERDCCAGKHFTSFGHHMPTAAFFPGSLLSAKMEGKILQLQATVRRHSYARVHIAAQIMRHEREQKGRPCLGNLGTKAVRGRNNNNSTKKDRDDGRRTVLPVRVCRFCQKIFGPTGRGRCIAVYEIPSLLRLESRKGAGEYF